MRAIFHHLLLLFVIACIVLVSSDCAELLPADVGVNLTPMKSAVFVDLFKHSLPFFARRKSGNYWVWEKDEVFNRNREGYPESIPQDKSATTEIPSNEGAMYQSGEFICLYDGEGQIELADDAQSIQETPGRIRVNVTRSDKITIRITQTNETNPVNNIRFIPSEFESNYTQQLFHPRFLEAISSFKVLRFTGWQNEAYNAYFYTKREWSRRTLVTSQTQFDNKFGVALEHMIELCNRMNASAWFSLSQDSDGTYVNEFATHVRDNLDPSLLVYVEYSSRVGLLKTQGVESANVFTNFTEVFGTEGRNRTVYVASASNWYYFPHMLGFYGNLTSMVDAIALEGMFGNFHLKFDDPDYDLYKAANMTLDEALELVRSSVLDAEVENNKLYHQAKIHGLQIIAFDGGPYLHAANYAYRNKVAHPKQYNITDKDKELAVLEQDLEDLLIEVNRHPLMKDIMMDHLKRWNGVGGRTFVTTALERPPNRCLQAGNDICGSTALMEPLQKTSPKLEGVKAYFRGENGSLPYTSADLPKSPIEPCNLCVWGSCYKGKCQCFAGYTGDNCNTTTSKPNDCNKNTGLNLAGLVDWSTEWTFVDLFKTSRDWVTQEFTSYTWNTDTKTSIEQLGYPTYLETNQIVGSMMARDLGGHYPKGTYTCLYDGDGIITFAMADVKKVTRFVGKILVEVEPSTDFNNGVFLRIERTNPADPIRNIRFIMPGFEEKYEALPFHPLFIHYIQHYSTIRFMDWMNTNAQTDEEWLNRTTPHSRTYSINGAALESMIQLANTIGANAWFNIPHKASDDYIKQFALMVKKQIRPDVKIYVEYSNEVWSTLFPGGIWAQNMGLSLNLNNDSHEARFCYLGLRTKNISDIWQDVFGPENRNRLVFVLASQAVNPDVSRRILDCGNAYKHVDALAIAPYFSGHVTKNDSGNDADIYEMDMLFNTTIIQSIEDRLSEVGEHYSLAKKRGLELITYESGQSLLALQSKLQTNLCIEANRDPRMEQMYRHYLSGLLQSNVSLITHFSSIGRYSVYGSWGLMEAIDQDPKSAPKFTAIQKFIQESNKCTFETYSCPLNCSGRGECLRNGTCACYFGNEGEFCEISEYVDYFDCGYKCTFDQGVCNLKQVKNGFQRYWGCDCKPGYEGAYCALPVCQGNCSWAGECVGPDQCKCFDGFSGKFCEKDCNCNGRGKCGSDNKCICETGFRRSQDGSSCEFDCKCPNSKQQCIGPNECSCLHPCVNGVCINGDCKCKAGYTGQSCDEEVPSANTGSPVGLNLGGVNYWSTEWVFVDVMKHAADWISQYVPNYYSTDIAYTWNTGAHVEMRPDGYPARLNPGQAVGTLMCRDVQGHCPTGVYVCLYDGSGKLNFGFDAKVINERKGRVELFVKPTFVRDNGIFLQIIATDPADPIRNIRVYMPGFEHVGERMPFHPAFLNTLTRYSALRFMDWANTNHDMNFTFAERPTKKYISQGTSKGVALEYMIELSNLLKVSPWFTIPHFATDDFIYQYAMLIKSSLRTDVKIYVELSNEVWNLFFPQGKYAEKRAAELKINRHQYYSERSQELFKIFAEVFGQERRKDLVFILGTQAVSTWVTDQIVSWKEARSLADAVGVAVYFDCQSIGSDANAPKVAITSIDSIFERCYNDIPNVEKVIVNQVNFLQTKNMSVITYESGAGLVEERAIYSGAETPGVKEKLIAVNRDPRMRALYHAYLDMFDKTGVGSKHPLMQFSSCATPSKYGSWGLIEYTTQDLSTAPKYQAVQDFIKLRAYDYKRKGCMDPAALNYDETAEVSDLSCTYPAIEVDTSGGKIEHSIVELDFPSNALQIPANISVDQVKYPPVHPDNETQLVSEAFRFGPHGLQFANPIVVCVVVDTPPKATEKIALYHSSNDEDWELADDSYYDPIQKKVCGKLHHFTIVGAMKKKVDTSISINGASGLGLNIICAVVTLVSLLLFL